MGLQQFYQLMDQGKFAEAFQMANTLKEVEQTEAHLISAIILLVMGEPDQAASLVERCFNNSSNTPPLHILALIGKFWLVNWRGLYEESLSFLQQAEQLLMKSPEWPDDTPHSLLTPLHLQTLVEQAKGVHYVQIGENDQAEEHFKKSLAVALQDSFPIKLMVLDLYNDLGVLAERKGEWDVGIDYYQKILVKCQEMGNQTFTAHALLLLSRNWMRQGDLIRATDYAQKSITIAEQGQIKAFIARGKEMLGKACHRAGDLSQALELYKEALKLTQEIQLKAYSDLAGLLYLLCVVSLDLKNYNQAHVYLAKLQEHNIQANEPMTTMYTSLAEVWILKANQRFKDKARAQDLLRDLIQESTTNQDIVFLGQLLLCHLLLMEFEMLGDEELFLETQTIASNLQEQSKNWHFIPDIIQVEILQAKFALISGDAQHAVDILEQAKSLAEERGLGYLISEIQTEQELLYHQLQKWTELVDRNASLQERVALAQVEDYLKEAIKMRNLSLE